MGWSEEEGCPARSAGEPALTVWMTVSRVFSCSRCFRTEDGALTKVIVSRVFLRSRCFTVKDGALTKMIVSRVRSDAQFLGDVCFHWLTTDSALSTVLQAAC